LSVEAGVVAGIEPQQAVKSEVKALLSEYEATGRGESSGGSAALKKEARSRGRGQAQNKTHKLI